MALLGLFENRSCELISGSDLEETADGEPELVVPGGADVFRSARRAAVTP